MVRGAGLGNEPSKRHEHVDRVTLMNRPDMDGDDAMSGFQHADDVASGAPPLPSQSLCRPTRSLALPALALPCLRRSRSAFAFALPRAYVR